jgi:hypothetical protein
LLSKYTNIHRKSILIDTNETLEHSPTCDIRLGLLLPVPEDGDCGINPAVIVFQRKIGNKRADQNGHNIEREGYDRATLSRTGANDSEKCCQLALQIM